MITRYFNLAFAAIVGTTETCGTRQDLVDLPNLFPDVPALAALTGVHPGMSVGNLRGLRKTAVPAPYIGLMELVNGDTIKYRMVSPPYRQSPREDVFFGRSRLLSASSIEGIDLWEPTTPMDSATRVWRDRAIRMRNRDPRTVDCFTIGRAGTTRVALGQRNGVWFGVALIEERQERDARGPITLPAIVDTFVTSELELYVPSRFKRQSMPCPEK